MPIDYECVLSVSPPIFTTRPYPTCDPYEAFGKPFANDIAKLNYSNFNFYKNSRNTFKNLFPLRSCLIVRSTDFSGLTKVGSKKRVVFADDKGFSLTSVKLVCEPSDCPPLWDDSFLERVTRGVKAEAAPLKTVWHPQFNQPAADYLKFRNKLESNCVSLENVIVKDCDDVSEQVITGTVKVKNLEFKKKVYVRVTFDGWKTEKDVLCDFVPGSADMDIMLASKRRYDLYDTFSFSVNLPDYCQQPRLSEAIEFCVRFVSGDSKTGSLQDFWDNNNGMNYRLVSSNSQSQIINTEPIRTQFEDALTAEIASWADFASWQHLINDNPYW